MINVFSPLTGVRHMQDNTVIIFSFQYDNYDVCPSAVTNN